MAAKNLHGNDLPDESSFAPRKTAFRGAKGDTDSRAAASGLVTVEFYGVPRQQAGRAELVVPAGTLAEALAEVERQCPALAGLAVPGGSPAPHYLVSIDGRRFIRDGQERLRPGERLLVLSADAGG